MASASATGSVNANTAASYAAFGGTPKRDLVQTLGQQDFLRLLVTQMTTQDPLKPSADTEFIGQMAQFSALEQSKSMQSDIATMRGDQKFLQAASLLGQRVELQVDKDRTATGLVEAVTIEAGTPKLVVAGHTYELGQVLRVQEAPVNPFILDQTIP